MSSSNDTVPNPQQAAAEAQQPRVESILTDLDASLAAGSGNGYSQNNGQHAPSPHSVADAQRAMSHTASWTPLFNRRQSWNKEEHKHAQHMSGLDEVKTGPGFSERS